MMTKLEVALCGLLILLLFLVGHKLTTAFQSKSEAQSTPGHSLQPPSTTIVPFPEVKFIPTNDSTVPAKQRVESSCEPANSDHEPYSTDTTEVITPIALAAPPDGLLTTEDQVTAFDSLRQQFLEAMTSVAQDPTSPEYLRRWQEQQELLDDQFAALFGVEAFNQQQNAAASAATQ